MVPADLDYVTRLIRNRAITGPLLELGTGYGGDTCRAVATSAGLAYYGTDLMAGDAVDFVADFERREDMTIFRDVAPFGAVVLLNVLEHTFNPLAVLDNARTLLAPGGSLVVLTPAVWPLHNFPMDAWRIMPNLYEEYALRRGMRLTDEYFEFVGFGRVRVFRNADGSYTFPPPRGPGGWRRWLDRAIHRGFDTFGRAMVMPSHVAVAAVLVAP
jgi:SAM-dependent methyltransferase